MKMYCEKCENKMRKVSIKHEKKLKDRLDVWFEHIGYWCMTCKEFRKVPGGNE